MKIFILFFVLSFPFLVFADSEKTVGRYQIQVISVQDQIPMAIMLDTATGETWRLFRDIIITSGPGTDTDAWIPISRLSEKEHREILFGAQKKKGTR